MANDDWLNARGGMLPAEYPYGAYRKNIYKLTTSAVAVYIGQPVALDANGQATATMTSVNTGATVVPLLGSVVGFLDTNFAALPNSVLSLTAGPYLPALTDAYVEVADDPDQIFVMQVSTAVTMTSANLGDYCSFNYTRATSGNTTTGYALAEVDANTLSSVGSGNLQIINLFPLKNSDGTTNSVGNYAKVRVRMTNPVLGSRLSNYTGI